MDAQCGGGYASVIFGLYALNGREEKKLEVVVEEVIKLERQILHEKKLERRNIIRDQPMVLLYFIRPTNHQLTWENKPTTTTTSGVCKTASYQRTESFRP